MALRGDRKDLCFLSQPDTFVDPLLRQHLSLFEKLDRLAQQIFVRKSRKLYCHISHSLSKFNLVSSTLEYSIFGISV